MKKDYEDKRVLVTGGTGFIGSRLVKKLVDFEAHVSLLVRPISDMHRLDALKDDIEVFQVDITDSGALERSIVQANPEIVFNLMGDTRNNRDVAVINELIDTNVKSLLRLAEALKKSTPRIVVSMGTFAEYGTNPIPFVESQAENPCSPYGLSKALATQVARYLAHVEGFPIVTLRPSLVYGPGQPRNQFIGEATNTLLLGNTLHTTKLAQTRDFVYVDDVVDALLKVPLSDARPGEIINICSGEERSLQNVLQTICRATNKDFNSYVIMDKPYRSGEQMRYVGSREKANKVLNWQPSVSLEEGLRRTINYDK